MLTNDFSILETAIAKYREWSRLVIFMPIGIMNKHIMIYQLSVNIQMTQNLMLRC